MLGKTARTLRWLPSYAWQRVIRSGRGRGRPLHLMVAIADHFEPAFLPDRPSGFASLEEQESRLERWCRAYPRAAADWRDADGFPMRHTYFYPAEQYHPHLLDRLAEHCRAGWGEVEVHLHHGSERPDTAENTRCTLTTFRDRLAGHGCLSRWDGLGEPRYAFVHGNWALANSAGNRHCGVDGEMKVLSETGCYADFTLPSAPDPAQVAKINSLYECALPLDQRAPHRRGRDLRLGRPPRIFPLIVQGPLGMTLVREPHRLPRPRIENGGLMTSFPPSAERLRLWRRAAIGVQGKPDWIFVKLHCHGMDPRDEEVMTGELRRRFLRELAVEASDGRVRLHFVTARELVNIALAACDGREGSPGDFRDYRLRPIQAARAP